MSVEVVMPQMGESIAEGTISRWLKEVGETVERDEPLLEISTDKVDAEVPAPEGGVLLEQKFQEGDTVEVDTVIAVLGAEGETASAAPVQEAAPEPEPTPEVAPEPAPEVEATAPAPEETAPAVGGEATEVVMPQMGESIAEGTVSRWMKEIGDTVERDEPLLEISTDKVDAEVPSPVAGTLLEIRAEEGETVEVDAVIAVVGAAGASVTAATSAPSVEEAAPAPSPEPTPAPVVETPVMVAESGNGSLGDQSVDHLRKTRSSPLVRNIAKEHNIDISQIPGSGLSGRVTKQDILSFIESGAAVTPEQLKVTPAPTAQPTPVAEQPSAPHLHLQRLRLNRPHRKRHLLDFRLRRLQQPVETESNRCL